VNVSVLHDHSGGDIDVYARDSSRNLIERDIYDRDDASVSFTADDDGAAGLNAQLTGVELPATGEYTLVATSYWEDRTFAYTLPVDRRSSATGSAAVTGVAGPALPGESVTVEFSLTNTGGETQPLLLYTGVDDLPAGWTVSDRSDDGGVRQAGDAVWLFREIEPGESVTLAVPDGAEAGAERTLSVRAFNGTYNDTASVTVAVQDSTLAALLDENDDGRIGDAEILTAEDEERAPGEWPSERSDSAPGEPGDGDEEVTTTEGSAPDLAATEPDATPAGTFYCPNCGFTERRQGSALREGDACPECMDGYLETR